jgi:hypothetical protein
MTMLAAVGLIMVACTPMRMGLQEATLEGLLEKQAACDQQRKQGFTTDAKMIECQNNGNALEKSAGEYAAEGGRQANAANKVFWYSLAATAGWRSQRPQGMQDAITYADEGVNICDKNSGIQPGDCAFMYAIPAFVANESVTTAFIDLEARADKAAEGQSLSEKKITLQKLYMSLQSNGLTRIETMASTLLQDGWETLENSWQNVRKLKGLHQDVICALARNQTRMVANLKVLHKSAATLPLEPEDTDWIADSFCQNGNIDAQNTAGLNLPVKGTDFEKQDENGKLGLMHRAMVHTYCAWQYAWTHTQLEICPRD